MDLPTSLSRTRRGVLRMAPAAFAAKLSAQKQPGEVITDTDYQQNLKDARGITDIARSIELDIEKAGPGVLPLAILKKLDDIDKTARRIRGRMTK